ncbi:Undecaprenyl-diphosphatase [Baekduia alba]|uniref:undecaprenyl-diphosphate phosphatase n=1 Tax=Baekduia alba TaxID=2997333 RepID=UPI00234131C7|nr:undecaprenyl-diphosphate phosphatase [Baekduia alba]WCB91409.1 Undecaprenyl-diphosphatase [Baekduia alba]
MPRKLTLGQAALLGALHGPAELLPVSSSGHTALVPQLAGWAYADLPGDLRKTFEIALHAGTLPALVVLVPTPRPALLVVSTIPPALAGLLFEDLVEERLGTTRGIALGLLLGSAAMLLADAIGDRSRTDAGAATAADALVVGLAQACALVPGASRLGLSVAAARLRGFDRPAAFALARGAGLPVIAGATALKTVRLARRGLPRELRAPFAVGAVAALASTFAAAPLRAATSVVPAAAERALLAGAALVRAR